jgi:hypothetical protein
MAKIKKELYQKDVEYEGLTPKGTHVYRDKKTGEYYTSLHKDKNSMPYGYAITKKKPQLRYETANPIQTLKKKLKGVI